MIPEVSVGVRNIYLKIALFYSIITYIIFPFIGLAIKKNKEGITHGMIAGSILSIFLWFKYGANMMTLQ